jgi:hypothetical protein
MLGKLKKKWECASLRIPYFNNHKHKTTIIKFFQRHHDGNNETQNDH